MRREDTLTAKELLASDENIEAIVHVLKGYAPEKIILFGSRARGEADEYSNMERRFAGAIKSPTSFLFAAQFQHILLLAGLVPGAMYLAMPALEGTPWLGIPDYSWFYGLIIVAIVHQAAGWFVFRTQLLFALFTRLCGKYDLLAWGIIFFPLFVLRPIPTMGLGIADFGSLEAPRGLQIMLGLVLLIPVAYTGWSVAKYFGVKRALGGDHFRQKYRHMPLVEQAAFKYSSNAMY